MAQRLKWQRGMVDMVSLGVGMLLLGIVTAGTTASMVYGREALLREEHYKVAANILRGKMEERIAEIQLVQASRTRSKCGTVQYLPGISLDAPGDRGGVRMVVCYLTQEKVDSTDLPETGIGTDYYTIYMKAVWNERPYAENGHDRQGIRREIKLVTSVTPMDKF
jgi:hypothetical protein